MMRCPKCVNMLKAYGTRFNKRDNHYTRTRVCCNKECGYRTYTIEIPRNTYDATYQLVNALQRAIKIYLDSREG